MTFEISGFGSLNAKADRWVEFEDSIFRFLEDLFRKLFRISTLIIGRWVRPVPLSSVRLGRAYPGHRYSELFASVPRTRTNLIGFQHQSRGIVPSHVVFCPRRTEIIGQKRRSPRGPGRHVRLIGRRSPSKTGPANEVVWIEVTPARRANAACLMLARASRAVNAETGRVSKAYIIKLGSIFRPDCVASGSVMSPPAQGPECGRAGELSAVTVPVYARRCR